MCLGEKKAEITQFHIYIVTVIDTRKTTKSNSSRQNPTGGRGASVTQALIFFLHGNNSVTVQK